MHDTVGKGPNRGQTIGWAVPVHLSFKILGSRRSLVIVHRPSRIHRVSRPTSTKTVQASSMTVARFTITWHQ